MAEKDVVMVGVAKDELYPYYVLEDESEALQADIVQIPQALFEQYCRVMEEFQVVQDELEQYHQGG